MIRRPTPFSPANPRGWASQPNRIMRGPAESSRVRADRRLPSRKQTLTSLRTGQLALSEPIRNGVDLEPTETALD